MLAQIQESVSNLALLTVLESVIYKRAISCSSVYTCNISSVTPPEILSKKTL